MHISCQADRFRTTRVRGMRSPYSVQISEVHHNVSRQYVFDKNVLIYCTPCNNVLNKNVLMCLLRHKVLAREYYNIVEPVGCGDLAGGVTHAQQIAACK